MTETGPVRAGAQQVSRHSLFADYIGKKIVALQERYLRDDPRARADLARLRRTVSRPVGADADSWPIVFERFPPQLMGRGDDPSRWESAAHIAFGLFAQHMQSAKRPMHVAGWGLGRAIRRLANPLDAESREKPVMRRFQALGTASHLTEAVHHARGMIQQLRAEEIPLDYVRLARDLVDLQNPRAADAVRLRWARDLYRTDQVTSNPSAAE
jgi:CRISPR system Cascade subunit CasB